MIAFSFKSCSLGQLITSLHGSHSVSYILSAMLSKGLVGCRYVHCYSINK